MFFLLNKICCLFFLDNNSFITDIWSTPRYKNMPPTHTHTSLRMHKAVLRSPVWVHCLAVCSLSSSRQEKNINVWRWPSALFASHHAQQWLCTIDLHLSLWRISQTCVTANVCMIEMSCFYCRSPELDQTSTAEKQDWKDNMLQQTHIILK